MKAICLKGGNKNFITGNIYDVMTSMIRNHITVHSNKFVYQGELCKDGLIKVYSEEIYTFKLEKGDE